jgi:YHS domain-containing protein
MHFGNSFARARRTLAGILLLTFVVLPVGGTLAAVTGELVVADQRAGVALFGFDPVAYFLRGEAEIGSEDLELTFSGLSWRFSSEANRSAFRAQPDVYVPQFGGYDPIALSRGAPVAVDPAIFVVLDGRLFMFQKPEHRVSFLVAPEAVIEAARLNWPAARRSLVH